MIRMRAIGPEDEMGAGGHMGEESRRCRGARFRLGTTSFIYPAGWLANVEQLAGRVADVELLFFDAAPGALPSLDELTELRAFKERTGLTYSVHGPLDIGLASVHESRRRASLETVGRCVEAARLLSAEALVLHLYLGEQEGEVPPDDLEAWRLRARRSLEEILRMGIEPAALCLESLDYDFALAEPVLDELGIGAALDLGHAKRDGRSVMDLLRRNLHRARVIHWHGVGSGGRDHLSLRHWPHDEALELLRAITEGDYRGALTLEVFGERDLSESIDVLDALWEELNEHP